MAVLGIESKKADAEKARKFLAENSLLLHGYAAAKTEVSISFATQKITPKMLAKLKKIANSAKVVKKNFKKTDFAPRTIKDALKGKLTPREMKFAPSSFDLLGDVAIIEVADELEGKEKILGQALLKVNTSVESVYLKTGAHAGVFRNEPVKFVTGKKKKFATYREHGCVFHITLGEVFFSPRLSTERIRIAKEIAAGEKIAALFAGVGPFPIIFAKNSRMSAAVAIELNPVAVEDMKENIKLNHVEGRVVAVLGDVKALAAEYEGQFDRVVMPLPKGGETFLEAAIRYAKPEGGIVHFYQFVPRENPFDVPFGQIRLACERTGRKFEIIFRRKVRDFAPDIIQVVVDFRVWA
ncbi:MAG TPA: class I SAM-dependent methyltransferase family protein [archaeon]|nr:class I SAM-dependent methyltransferase family protein [archaeon]